ncbi:MAG: hypothetical protein DMG32_10665 [Acidobacteria bacterium]|nr:MAG: hypothetical protein DMG32_10665 [Acidobacteriota bacterium]
MTLVCLGILIFAGLGWAKTYHFASTKIDPSATGDVDISKDKNGNSNVNLRVEHLAKPGLLTPPANFYVVWFQQSGDNPENEGQLQVGNDFRGQLKTTTPLHNFDIFVTAESDPTAKTPSDQIVLRATVHE